MSEKIDKNEETKAPLPPYCSEVRMGCDGCMIDQSTCPAFNNEAEGSTLDNYYKTKSSERLVIPDSKTIEYKNKRIAELEAENTKWRNNCMEALRFAPRDIRRKYWIDNDVLKEVGE